MQPSAPAAIDDEDFVHRYRMHQPRSDELSPASPQETIVANGSQSDLTPNPEDSLATAPSSLKLTDDKQELEMRRLQDQASSPDANNDGAIPMEPTAPILNDNPHHEVHNISTPINNGTEGGALPLYKR